jgi:hypothetical protein
MSSLAQGAKASTAVPSAAERLPDSTYDQLKEIYKYCSFPLVSPVIALKHLLSSTSPTRTR